MSWCWCYCEVCGKKYGKIKRWNKLPKTQVKGEKQGVCFKCYKQNEMDDVYVMVECQYPLCKNKVRVRSGVLYHGIFCREHKKGNIYKTKGGV